MCLPHSAYLINGSFTDSASDCVTEGGGDYGGVRGGGGGGVVVIMGVSGR